jgi:hypothetical protein
VSISPAFFYLREPPQLEQNFASADKYSEPHFAKVVNEFSTGRPLPFLVRPPFDSEELLILPEVRTRSASWYIPLRLSKLEISSGVALYLF